MTKLLIDLSTNRVIKISDDDDDDYCHIIDPDTLEQYCNGVRYSVFELSCDGVYDGETYCPSCRRPHCPRCAILCEVEDILYEVEQ